MKVFPSSKSNKDEMLPLELVVMVDLSNCYKRISYR